MIPKLVFEDDNALTEVVSKAFAEVNLHSPNASQDILENIFKNISDKNGITVVYPSEESVLNNLHELGLKELHLHKAINSKMMSHLWESLMSKAILAISRFIDSYINKVDEVMLTENNMQTVVGSLRSLFELMEQMDKMRNRYAISDPDRVLGAKGSEGIDRSRIDQLRRELSNGLSN